MKQLISDFWDQEALPSLMDFIRIPAKSTAFDCEWKEHRFLHQTCKHVATWIKKHIPDARCEILQENDRTPCLFVAVLSKKESLNDTTVAFYGHFDRQPEASGWDEGLGPWEPVIRNGKLYGRGASDDGYSVYMMISAITTLRQQGIEHPRCVGIFETQEESGSKDLPYYLDLLKDRFQNPTSLFVLDSHCGDYERVWLSSSLRGILGGTLTVKAMEYGVHSGTYSGMVPDAFSIAQALIARVHDPITGEIKLDAFKTEIPEIRRQQLIEASEVLGDLVWNHSPLLSGVTTKKNKNSDVILNMTWQPALTIIGMEGLPSIANAANVVTKEVKFALSMRIPPNINIEKAAEVLEETLKKDPPFGVHVEWDNVSVHPGWAMTAENPKNEELINQASLKVFNKKAIFTGQGGSISFIGDFESTFPNTTIVLTGVLGPNSNAHAPNESLDIQYTKDLTEVISEYLKSVI